MAYSSAASARSSSHSSSRARTSASYVAKPCISATKARISRPRLVGRQRLRPLARVVVGHDPLKRSSKMGFAGAPHDLGFRCRRGRADTMKPGLGTAAALILGLLATIGSIAMGLSNLQLLLR